MVSYSSLNAKTGNNSCFFNIKLVLGGSFKYNQIHNIPTIYIWSHAGKVMLGGVFDYQKLTTDSHFYSGELFDESGITQVSSIL
jgi:hypothetical protein